MEGRETFLTKHSKYLILIPPPPLWKVNLTDSFPNHRLWKENDMNNLTLG